MDNCFDGIRLDDFKKNNTEHSSIERENERTEIGKERTVKGEDYKKKRKEEEKRKNRNERT